MVAWCSKKLALLPFPLILFNVKIMGFKKRKGGKLTLGTVKVSTTSWDFRMKHSKATYAEMWQRQQEWEKVQRKLHEGMSCISY
jgi:hypothetical protein